MIKRLFLNCVVVSLVLFVAASALAGPAVELKLKDGSKWRGQVTDAVEVRFVQQGVEVAMEGKLTKVDNLYIQIETVIAGKMTAKTIFKSDIVAVKTTKANDGSSPAAATPASGNSTSSNSGSSGVDAKADPNAKSLGVFVLPLDGSVGETFRHEEIKKMGEYLDKNYPPNQILVLLINSNGGSSLESQKIAECIFEIKKRHRVVAWIHKAISAGCQTAMCCNEIYFMTEGTAGSVTTWNPGSGQSIKGADLEAAMEDLARIAIASGYDKSVAYAMKTNKALCSYTRDPVTGDVTWYDDKSGKVVLSDEDSNLCFNASNALDCKFSKGTADTNEDLAKFLNLPKWHEISDYGRRLAKDWQRTCEQATEQIPALIAQMSYKNQSTGDDQLIISTQIQILKQLINWIDKCPNVARQRLPEKEDLEREILQLQKTLADIKKARGAGR